MGVTSEKTEFCVDGQFLGYVFKDGHKIKRLELATGTVELSIKMTETARLTIGRTLLPGDQIRVWGIRKVDPKTSKVKLKARAIHPLTLGAMPLPPEISQWETALKTPIKPAGTKQTILMCQKSSCMKRGGKAVCQALDKALTERGLTEQVQVKGTGCMKACSQGANVVMPGKVRYTKVQAKDVPALVDEHFAGEPLEKAAPAKPVSATSREQLAVRL
jgi:(2Fe-2S) ferredoxin/Cu/Ag efflux protein CusF